MEVGQSYPQEQPCSLTSLVGFSDGDSSDEQVSGAKKSHLFPTDLDVSGGVHLERESVAEFELFRNLSSENSHRSGASVHPATVFQMEGVLGGRPRH